MHKKKTIKSSLRNGKTTAFLLWEPTTTQCQEMVQRHEEERRHPAPSFMCSVCPGNGWCRFARPNHQCSSHWNLEQEMVVGVVFPHAQYLHGECLAALFVSKQEDPMDLPNFMRHVTRHHLRVQESDTQRAATSAAVP